MNREEVFMGMRRYNRWQTWRTVRILLVLTAMIGLALLALYIVSDTAWYQNWLLN